NQIAADRGDHDGEPHREGRAQQPPAPAAARPPLPALPRNSLSLLRLEVCVDRRHHPLAELRRRLKLLPGLAENRARRGKGLELAGAARAARRGRLHFPRPIGLERAQRVGDQFVPVRVFPDHRPSARFALILSIPRRIRPFTVPSGSFSISAISEWLKPPKNASRITRDWSS